LPEPDFATEHEPERLPEPDFVAEPEPERLPEPDFVTEPEPERLPEPDFATEHEPEPVFESEPEAHVEVEHEPEPAPEPPAESPFIKEPAAAEVPVLPPPKTDDPRAKSQPIMVGSGDPFSDDDGVEIEAPAASVVPVSTGVNVTAEDNQLHLQLKGSGAIAEMGQVRALDIEVPVPGQWVGNRKVTLQLRLTLTPAEEDNG
jgi:hypothetical protein